MYLGTSAVVFGLQAAFYAFVHVRFAEYYAALIGAPLVGAVVMVFAGADATGTLPAASERWGRIIERAWAIIVIDVGISFVQVAGLQTIAAGASDAGSALMGMLALFLAAMLVYAEPFACLETQVRTRAILPLALMRSMMLAWTNMSRIFSLFAIELALSIADVGVLRLGTVAGLKDPNWLELLFWTMATAPLALLFTVAYLDTLSQEQSAAQ